MPAYSNISRRLLLYPMIGLLLVACGATPAVTNQATTTDVAQAVVPTAATSAPSALPTVVLSLPAAPTTTAAPTDTVAPATAAAPTGTSIPAVTMTPSPAPTIAPPTSQPVPTPQPAPASAAAKVMAEIKLFQFKPNPLEIKAGTTVVWTNQDAIEHSVTGGTPPSANGTFDSGFFTQGQSFTFTFTKPGTYTYFCMRHNSMTGTVHVTAP